MARVVREETSLRAQSRALRSEARWLRPTARIEAGLAAALLLAALFSRSPWAGRLIGAGIVFGFLALAHVWRHAEAIRDAGFWEAGRRGEHTMALRLAQDLGNDTWVLNDIVLRQGRRRVQIDHAVVTPAGVFIIETKHWRGEIEGAPDDRTWRRIGRAGKRDRCAPNPIFQNRRQAEAVRSRLSAHGFDAALVFPLVVFTEPSVRLRLHPEHPRVVCGAGAAVEHIQRRTAHPVWDAGQCEAVCEALGAGRKAS